MLKARRRRKEQRYALRTALWSATTLKRCGKCGRVPMGQSVGLRIEAGAAGFSGLGRLGVWLERNADELLGWVLGIVGFLLASDAGQRLGLVHLFG